MSTRRYSRLGIDGAKTYDQNFRETWSDRIENGTLLVKYGRECDPNVLWRFSRDIRQILAGLGRPDLKPHFVREQ